MVKMGINGFSYDTQKITPINSCEKINDFYTKLAILLDKRGDNFTRWEPLINKCQLEISKSFQIMINISKDELSNENNLNQYLKVSGIKSKERKEILEIYRKNEIAKSDQEIVGDYIDYLSVDKSKLSEQKIFFLNKQMMSKAKKCKSPFLRSLMELGLATSAGNRIWAKKSMVKIINMAPKEIIFHTHPDFFKNSQEREKFEDEVFKDLKRTEELLNIPVLTKIFVNRLDKMMSSARSKKAVENFSAQWSLVELREILKSTNFGTNYFGFWYQEIYNRTSEAEILSILNRIINEEYVNNLHPGQNWIFREYLPNNGKLRNSIFDSIVSDFNSSNPFHKYVATTLLENEVIKSQLGKRDKIFRRALFQIERELYHHLLNKGVAVNFSLYNLIALGDKDDSNLWWLVL